MQFSVGDKVVHPHHGPGRITAIERKEFVDGLKRYYVIEIPSQGLTLYVPRQKVDKVGVRLAMTPAKLSRVLDTLRSSPHRLPKDYKERQEYVQEKLRTGRPIPLAEVVRDLTWHRLHAHLTRKDADYLQWGRDFLAGEMALASDTEITEIDEGIDAALALAMASATSQAGEAAAALRTA